MNNKNPTYEQQKFDLFILRRKWWTVIRCRIQDQSDDERKHFHSISFEWDVEIGHYWKQLVTFNVAIWGMYFHSSNPNEHANGRLSLCFMLLISKCRDFWFLMWFKRLKSLHRCIFYPAKLSVIPFQLKNEQLFELMTNEELYILLKTFLSFIRFFANLMHCFRSFHPMKFLNPFFFSQCWQFSCVTANEMRILKNSYACYLDHKSASNKTKL